MLQYVYHVLDSFRSIFSRRRAWLLFCILVLGFLGASHSFFGQQPENLFAYPLEVLEVPRRPAKRRQQTAA
jgi:hypothetical protein